MLKNRCKFEKKTDSYSEYLNSDKEKYSDDFFFFICKSPDINKKLL